LPAFSLRDEQRKHPRRGLHCGRNDRYTGTMSFRSSAYINFNTGTVSKPPMVLVGERPKPWSLSDKLDLFESRVDVWQLGPAVAILRLMEAEPSQSSIWAHSAYALVAILFSYFEMVGKILNPHAGRSKTASKDFNYGFCDVYNTFATASPSREDKDLPDVASFRDRVRNGMYHLAYTKRGLFLHNDPQRYPDDFTVDATGTTAAYRVNPHQMTRTLVAHFPTLMARLRHPDLAADGLREQFRKFFDDFH
jgi:hypothetical protein